jgi:hypothetical protein
VSKEEGLLSRPSSASCCATSAAVTEPLLARSRTAKDSRIVWRCCGGIELKGSEEARARGAGDGDGEAALTVDAVALLGNVGLVTVEGLSKGDMADDGPGDECSRSKGDLVGLPGVFKHVFVPRVVSHERSSAPVAGRELNGREDVDEVNLDGECVGVLFDCFRGEPPGVPARRVDGDRPRADSGRRKGDARPPALNKGAGLSGEDGFD